MKSFGKYYLQAIVSAFLVWRLSQLKGTRGPPETMGMILTVLRHKTVLTSKDLRSQ